MSTLADLMTDLPSGHRYIELIARPSMNLGNLALVTSVDVGSFLTQSIVGNKADLGPVTQRPLNINHAVGMAAFNLGALMTSLVRSLEMADVSIPADIKAVYDHLSPKAYYAWAPIVCSVRASFDTITAVRLASGEWSVKLKPDQRLWVIDGQHRRQGLAFTKEWLEQIIATRKYPRVKAGFPPGLRVVAPESVPLWQRALDIFTSNFTVTAEVHFGLSVEQEQQLFYFLNDLGRAVPAGISQSFDHSNPINLFTRDLVESGLFDGEVVDTPVNWDDAAWIRRDSLNGVNARLFLNHTSIDSAKANVVTPRYADARAFWEAVAKIPNICDRKLSLAAQPAMLKAIAKCYYDLKWARGSGRTSLPADTAEKFLEALPLVNFSHGNFIWRGGGSGKNLGTLNADGTFRFAPTHNEIVPVLAATLRQATCTV